MRRARSQPPVSLAPARTVPEAFDYAKRCAGNYGGERGSNTVWKAEWSVDHTGGST